MSRSVDSDANCTCSAVPVPSKENLHKVGGSIKRLKAAETCLWQGQVQSAIALFVNLKKKSDQNFISYLKKHSERIVNYKYFDQQGLCSIGSGAVESAVKQIGKRIKISGTQWKERKRTSDATASICLPQWSAYCLIFLQKWDAPIASGQEVIAVGYDVILRRNTWFCRSVSTFVGKRLELVSWARIFIKFIFNLRQ